MLIKLISLLHSSSAPPLRFGSANLWYVTHSQVYPHSGICKFVIANPIRRACKHLDPPVQVIDRVFS